MDERAFVAGSRPTWERLGEAARAARADGVASLGAERLKRMHEDYRQAAADLAYAQTHFPDSEAARYLNGLVGQAHGELYGATPQRMAAMWRFVATGYPRLVRKHARPILLASAVLAGAVALGFLLARVDYPVARLFLPAAYRDIQVEPITAGQQARDLMTPFAPLLSAGITVNNVQVAIIAFAGGVTFGVMTVWAMFQNGMLLGVLAGLLGRGDQALAFWGLIVPHGSLELPAIALAGGGGLMLARALLAPGDLPRLEALRRVSGDAARVLLGTVPLFITAGLVEGFITPRSYPDVLKLALGALLVLALAAYIGLAGRGGDWTGD